MMQFRHNNTSQAGFTLVELMVSMTIFTVLVVVGIGAVLQATSQYYMASNMRAIMDNLNFVMEDMSRNIRTGSQIRCVTSATDSAYPGYIVSGTVGSTDDVIPASCADPADPQHKIIFKANSGTNLTYVITPPPPVETTNPNKIIKIAGDSSSPQVITPAEIEIDFSKSGFTVRGSSTTADGLQPTVTIRLAGTVKYKTLTSKFAIQNTVVMRQLEQ
jgi:prepilin-type N-terminal cleavage/methylation domain-containing protein